MIGFNYLAQWVDTIHVQDMISRLIWDRPSIRMFGKLIQIPRLTCWMGERSYTYSGHKNIPAETPEIIKQLQAKIESYTGAKFNSVLANYYRDGSDSVSWHSDNEPELGDNPTIASLSFGASRDFQVKNKLTGERASFLLNHGDLLIMSGKSQADYLHSVPKTTKKIGARVNLTFRLIK